MTVDRRSFLRGLVGAAVAVQLPSLPIFQQDAIAEDLTTKLLQVIVNGKAINDVTLTHVSNGWYRAVAKFKGSVSGGVEMDFRAMNDGQGLFIGDEKHVIDYMEQNPTHIAVTSLAVPDMTISPYLPQLEENAATRDYTFTVYVKGKT